MKSSVLAACWLLSSSAMTTANDGDGIPTRPEPLGPSIESVLERVTPSVVIFGPVTSSNITARGPSFPRTV